ncbi:MAG: carbohydrate kinase [Candidatus Anammoximicrobium sp.]|nr:carbohydrate kinase [Candidatus Anammoximicrobium sp.]
MGQYLLGVDNGSTMVKAAVFRTDGTEVSAAGRKVELLAPRPGWSEADMEGLWQLTAEAIREAVVESRVPAAEIACVACTGHGNGLYLVDRAGRPVRPAVRGTDTRARAYIDRWLADGVDRAVRPKTMQAIWPAQPNALLAWMQDHESASLQRAAASLTCKDYIRLRLTGEIHQERTDLSGCSLLNVGTGEYDLAVLEAFGIGDLRRLLPTLKRSEDICGSVTPPAAALTGLAAGTPVAGGMFDIDACGLASGMVDESQLCMIVGTWGNNQYISRTPVVDESVFMTSCYAIPGYYLMLEGSATSASNLEWFVSEFFAAERERLSQTGGGSVYDLCNTLVAGTRPEQSGVIFLPFLYGCNASRDGKAGLLGWDGWQTRGHVLRAVYEGIVFSHRWHLERLLRFRSPPKQIRLSGGAARSAVWVQMFADILQTPVAVPAGTELGALGAAIGAAVALGCYRTYEAACAAMVRVTRACEPDRALADVYERKYARYRKVLDALAPLWPEFS